MKQKTKCRDYRCVNCDSTDIIAHRVLSISPMHGVNHKGQRYTSITRRRVQCRSCEQNQVMISWDFDPKKWSDK